MVLQQCRSADRVACLRALIVSEVRFLRESLAEILDRASNIEVRGQCATLEKALNAAVVLQPEIVLLDVAFPSGQQLALQLRAAAPAAAVVALAVAETEENVLAWAEVGIAGYVPTTASVDELATLIGQISRGEQTCPSRIAGSLLRRVGSVGSSGSAAPPLLTQRESEVLRLVGAGLSNKEIARRLGISLGTTKTHVHNLLGKLSVPRRAQAMTSLHPARRGRVDAGPA
jgi:DNA-binding NarL/FixJ family response regulator